KMKKYPVSKSINLGSRGLLLYGEDPTNNSNQKELVLVKDAKIEWFSQCMPSHYKVIPVYSLESNYVYFVEDNYENGGILNYVFIDNSGTSRKGKVNISQEFRRIGVNDASKLELVQMHSTESYFMILFEEKGKSETSNYAMFISHASQRFYPMKLVHSSYEGKDVFKSAMRFLGTKDQKIILAQRTKEANFEGFYLSEIQPKEGKDETRKIEFPISKMAYNQKITLEGSYVTAVNALSTTSTVKTSEFLGEIMYPDNTIVIMGMEYDKAPVGVHIKIVDASYNEVLNIRNKFEGDDEMNRFLEKLKNGSFGFEFTRFRNYLIGAISEKESLFLYFDKKTGKLVQQSMTSYNFETLRNNAYYILEDLRKKKYAWFEACNADMYYSESKIWGKEEFKIYRSKL
ncbi:MAG: hypothetical protein R2799_16255, partial [Crocinitomicaceae bacterium]